MIAVSIRCPRLDERTMKLLRSTVMGLAYQIWHITHIVPTLARLPTHSDTLPILSMHAINRFLYGPTPEERVRAWQGKLRQESRVLDREMRQVWLLAMNKGTPFADSRLQLDIETNKVRQTIKQLSKKGDIKSARILAREVVRSNKQKDRLSVSKARLGSIGTQLSQQLGTFPPPFFRLNSTYHFHSNGQGVRLFAEIYRDYEAI